TMATRSCSGQCSGGAIDSANESSSRSPAYHSTKPPGTERAAEPEPRRARRLSSRWDKSRPSAHAVAHVSAAKPEADEAMPAAIGKLLRDTTRTPHFVPVRARN